MCKNIRTLYNFEPPATADEIYAAAQQFVRKISGFAGPSAVNEKASSKLLNSLVTAASPRNREVEAARARARAVRRFSS